MSGRTIEVVLFDLDDTLHDDTQAYHSAAEDVAVEIAAEHGIDALLLKAAYIAEVEGFWKRLSTEALKTKLETARAQMWESALKSVGVEDRALAVRTARNYHEYRKRYYTPFPGAADLLRTLRARGKRLGILTNGFSETHYEKIDLLRIGEYFDAIFLPDETGMIKPDPLLFAHACTALGSAPARCAMVGDRYDRDVRGAREAGLYTIWLNVRNETLSPEEPPPDATCFSLVDVERALAKLEVRS